MICIPCDKSMTTSSYSFLWIDDGIFRIRLSAFTKQGYYYRIIFGKVSEKRDLACILKKHNKNAPRLKCYNFRTVNATVFLFSALHNTPFLYDKIHFGILNVLHASVAMSDTPWGSNSPYLSARNLNSFQN